jgi:hypothetical protein
MHTSIRLHESGSDEKVIFIVTSSVADWIQNEDEEVPEELANLIDSAEEHDLPEFVAKGESFEDHIWKGEEIDSQKANAIANLYENFDSTSEMMNYISENNIIVMSEWQGYLFN